MFVEKGTFFVVVGKGGTERTAINHILTKTQLHCREGSARVLVKASHRYCCQNQNPHINNKSTIDIPHTHTHTHTHKHTKTELQGDTVFTFSI
jgi:hypothetical protein